MEWRQDLDAEHTLCCSWLSWNDDQMWSTSCLIMQYKPSIVELSFMEAQESNESIN